VIELQKSNAVISIKEVPANLLLGIARGLSQNNQDFMAILSRKYLG
jgi:hypothetical protein